MKDLNQGWEAEAILYRFENGAYISRITSPYAMLMHMVATKDWKSLEEGRHIFFALRVPVEDDPEIDSVSVVIGSPTAAKSDMWDHFWQATGEKTTELDWTTEYWSAFGQEMLSPTGELPEGIWGNIFSTPLWVKSSIYDRIDDLYVETRLHSIAEEISSLYTSGPGNRAADRIDALHAQIDSIVADHLAKVFEGYPIDEVGWVTLSFDNLNSKIKAEEMRFDPRFEYGRWVLMSTDGYPGSTGESLKEAFLKFRFPDPPFSAPFGLMMDQVFKDRWYDDLPPGHPTLPPEVLEPYFLLGESSPLLWPHDRFVAWWDTVKP